MLVAGLQGVDDAEHLGRVAAGGGRVGEDGADLLVRVDDEDAADGKGNTLFVDVGGILVVDPVMVKKTRSAIGFCTRTVMRKVDHSRQGSLDGLYSVVLDYCFFPLPSARVSSWVASQR